ncbi:hypothetical protein RN001_000482 [Aquatica leii]|uniref:Tektin n=1 Tax=Aquatica leii TaxID=1421715 RepID=A0AAN7PMB8_9COLE|nr:hypothetical protein RN001_000482 [Aquatica leii]
MSNNMDINANNEKIISQYPHRFTLKEWYLNNRRQHKHCFDQQQLADRILAESDKRIDLIEEITSLNKREVEHQLESRLQQVEFVKEDLIKNRKEVCLEIDCIETYNERVVDAMANIKENALVISRKCISFREGRIGIDLCHDEVEMELLKEIQMIESVIKLLQRILEHSSEQIRRLRAVNYLFDSDLDDKDDEIKIDKQNILVNKRNMYLNGHHMIKPIDPAGITLDEWAEYSNKTIEKSANELNSSRSLRAYIDNLLKQIVEDLMQQCNTVNDAFQRRIEETKEAKSKLEFNHGEISKQVSEITNKILKIEKTMKENEEFMKLSYKRMSNRCERPRMELVRDLVETHLVAEIDRQNENCLILQQSIAEAQTTLRYLLKTQIQLTEDINIKINTLKIDEVDCMTLRQGMKYHHY